MYPNLYYAFKDLFGIEIEFLKMVQSFGFFVAVAFLVSAWVFAKELKRKQELGLLTSTSRRVRKGVPPTWKDYLPSLAGGFILGYKLLLIIIDYDDFLNDTQGFILSVRGNPVGGIIGAGLFGYLRYRDWTKEQKKYPQPEEVNELMQPHEHVGSMTLLAAIGGILGAKLFDALEDPGKFVQDPLGVLFSFAGLAMYGGLIVGGLSVLWYAFKNKLNLLHVMDACAPGLMLAYAIGRIGCHVAGDGDWGIVNTAPKPEWMSGLPDWLWSYNYPNNVNGDCGSPFCNWDETPYLLESVFPTPLYEVLMCMALFGVLWVLRKRLLIPGLMFSVYLILNGAERFAIEQIRINITYSIMGTQVTQAEIIAVVLILLGIFGIYWSKKKAAVSSKET
ncbi:MAG: prolipoprotein diacylglyceryl transferase [Bacteroidia bacterium]|nr:prolipoprotein diacylglyceryl transferase [Bacteroidia bacterium]